MPRLSELKGPSLTPPSRVEKATRYGPGAFHSIRSRAATRPASHACVLERCLVGLDPGAAQPRLFRVVAVHLGAVGIPVRHAGELLGMSLHLVRADADAARLELGRCAEHVQQAVSRAALAGVERDPGQPPGLGHESLDPAAVRERRVEPAPAVGVTASEQVRLLPR